MSSFALINKSTLSLICRTKQVTLTYIAEKTTLNEERIYRWLDISDPSLPTFVQAKKIAKCLHIPFAGLYMNPEDVPLKHLPHIRNMRSISDSLFDNSSLNIAITDLLTNRDLLVDTKKELGEELPRFNLSMNTRENSIKHWASEIRRLFDISLIYQYKCLSTRQFYLYVRKQIEAQGIFVHCFSDVPVNVARGVAIFDNIMPIIGINAEDRPPAKTFSIIHELVHIFKRDSSMCNDMYNSFSLSEEEVFCNAVAGEVLVPENALKSIIRNHIKDTTYNKDEIQEIADKFSVSKEVIIRRLLDTGEISNSAYNAFADYFHRALDMEREEQRQARKDGKAKLIPRYMDREAIDRTSPSLCKILYQGYGEDLFNKQDISRYLGIDQKYVNKFLREVSSWNN
jgi:Zn-dependent peptidase ImmA (M78 family)